MGLINSASTYYSVKNNQIVKTESKKKFSPVIKLAIDYFSKKNQANDFTINDLELFNNLKVKCKKLELLQENKSKTFFIGIIYRIIHSSEIQTRKKLQSILEEKASIASVKLFRWDKIKIKEDIKKPKLSIKQWFIQKFINSEESLPPLPPPRNRPTKDSLQKEFEFQLPHARNAKQARSIVLSFIKKLESFDGKLSIPDALYSKLFEDLLANPHPEKEFFIALNDLKAIEKNADVKTNTAERQKLKDKEEEIVNAFKQKLDKATDAQLKAILSSEPDWLVTFALSRLFENAVNTPNFKPDDRHRLLLQEMYNRFPSSFEPFIKYDNSSPIRNIEFTPKGLEKCIEALQENGEIPTSILCKEMGDIKDVVFDIKNLDLTKNQQISYLVSHVNSGIKETIPIHVQIKDGTINIVIANSIDPHFSFSFKEGMASFLSSETALLKKIFIFEAQRHPFDPAQSLANRNDHLPSLHPLQAVNEIAIVANNKDFFKDIESQNTGKLSLHDYYTSPKRLSSSFIDTPINQINFKSSTLPAKALSQKYENLIFSLQLGKYILPKTKDISERINPQFKKNINIQIPTDKAYIKLKNQKVYENSFLNIRKAFLLKKSTSQETKFEMKPFKGLYPHSYSKVKLGVMEQLLSEISNGNTSLGLSTNEDIAGLKRIFQMRRIDLDMISRFSHDSSRKTVNHLKKLLNELSNPNSTEIIHLPDGSTTFGFGHIWWRHAIGIQFKKNTDGTYSLLIHNRGDNCDDKRLHGSFNFPYEGNNYRKTTFEIRTTLEHLQNDKFLYLFIKSPWRSGNFFYNKIHKYFIEQNRGMIHKSQHERDIEKLLEKRIASGNERFALDMQILEKIKQSSEFHTIQLYGTCVESNRTGLERELASENTRRAVRIHTSANFVNQLRDRIRDKKLSEKERQSIETTIVQGVDVIHNLRTKLKTNK